MTTRDQAPTAPDRPVPGAAAPPDGVEAAVRRAVRSGAVAGAVAMAVTREGVLHEVAEGRRALGPDAAAPAEADGDGHGHDGHGHDGQGRDARGRDGHRTDGHGADGRPADGHGVDGHGHADGGDSTGEAMTADTLFWIASMSKLVTSVAALQLVEAGRLSLHAPVGTVLPALAAPQVLEGFDARGEPVLRPARRPVTLHHLLTHTAGMAYEFWEKQIIRFQERTGLPSLRTGRLAALSAPLVFDPGERWLYSIATDWVGLAVEAASGMALPEYLQTRVFGPLGMTDTQFGTRPDQAGRIARMHRREADGSLAAVPFAAREAPEFNSGGGGLYSTGPDYARLLRMLLGGGALEGERLLRPDTVTAMGENQIGGLQTVDLMAARPELSNDVTFFAGTGAKWGLGSLVDTRARPDGRSAGTLSWGGLANTYFWVDPMRGLGGLFLAQVLPFADQRVLEANGAFEAACYRSLRG